MTRGTLITRFGVVTTSSSGWTGMSCHSFQAYVV